MIEKRTIDEMFKMIALVWGVCKLKNWIIWRSLRNLFINWKSLYFDNETIPE
jgi:hypothetical protein